MAFLRITSDTKGLSRFSTILRRPFAQGRGRKTIAGMRRVGAQEFAGGFGFGPGGGRVAWVKGHDFGTQKAKTIPLGGPGGALAMAWAGGAGGFATSTFREVTLGVDLPYAAVHRGGVELPSNTISTQTVTRRQAGFIGAQFGVHLAVGSTLSTPSRPHFDPRSPQMQRAVVLPLKQALEGAGA